MTSADFDVSGCAQRHSALSQELGYAPVIREECLSVAGIAKIGPSRHDERIELHEQLPSARVLRVLKERWCATDLALGHIVYVAIPFTQLTLQPRFFTSLYSGMGRGSL